MTDFPLDWRDVVDEARSRRAAEGLSQRALAELAGVSAPTVNAFEQGEIRLNFSGVAAILEALGMFVRPDDVDSLRAFSQRARRRWGELVADLPKDAPERQVAGHSEQAYQLDGVTPARTLRSLRDTLAQAPAYTGWPPFVVMTRSGLAPTIEDGTVQAWLGGVEDRIFYEPANTDFWQVAPTGKAYLQRGYQEDGRDLAPGTVFDLTLPIWRTGEVLRHAAWLARELDGNGDTTIRLSVRYTGLAGRVLMPWAKRGFGFSNREYRSRTDVVDLDHTTTVAAVEGDLGAAIFPVLEPLYDRFGGFELRRDFVDNEVAELPAARED